MALIFAGTHNTNSTLAPSPAGKGFGVSSIGDLARPGSYRRHSRFSHAVNFVDGNSLIAIVDETVGAGPVNIVADDLADWECGDLEIGTDGVHADGRDIPFQAVPRYDSSLRIPENPEPAPFRANLSTLRNHLIKITPDDSLVFLLDTTAIVHREQNFENTLRSKFVEAADLIMQEDLFQGVGLVKGLGRGLTPSGDDFIAGLLFALHLRGGLFGEHVKGQIQAIGEAAQSDNPFSRAMLDCAARGRAFKRLKHLINSLFEVDVVNIEARTEELTAIGATSGADLATGLVLGLGQIP